MVGVKGGLFVITLQKYYSIVYLNCGEHFVCLLCKTNNDPTQTVLHKITDCATMNYSKTACIRTTHTLHKSCIIQ